jgi:type II secretory pathway pseudopilin PulG
VAASSVLELVFALGVAATLAGIALPSLLASLDDTRAVGAARYVAACLQRTRMDAVRRNATVALRFTRSGDGYAFTPYVDGNHNGVLARDILTGVDAAVGFADGLSARFAGVEFATSAGLPAVDPDGVAPGDDPIRLGTGDMAVFTPDGTASSGTVYLANRRGAQYAVRMFGETGRTRVLKFDARRFVWMELGP